MFRKRRKILPSDFFATSVFRNIARKLNKISFKEGKDRRGVQMKHFGKYRCCRYPMKHLDCKEDAKIWTKRRLLQRAGVCFKKISVLSFDIDSSDVFTINFNFLPR